MNTRATGERGVATVWAAAALVVLAGLAGCGMRLGEAIVARHHAESAADLAALAGATTVLTGQRPACEQAQRVASRMRVRLASCHTRAGEVLVEVVAQPSGWVGRLGVARARARAGPLPAPKPPEVPPG